MKDVVKKGVMLLVILFFILFTIILPIISYANGIVNF